MKTVSLTLDRSLIKRTNSQRDLLGGTWRKDYLKVDRRHVQSEG